MVSPTLRELQNITDSKGNPVKAIEYTWYEGSLRSSLIVAVDKSDKAIIMVSSPVAFVEVHTLLPYKAKAEELLKMAKGVIEGLKRNMDYPLAKIQGKLFALNIP